MTDGLFPTFRAPALRDAVAQLSSTDETDRGAVYTKPEIVTTILDLAGYTVDRPLHEMRVLEPSSGGGDFLLPLVARLLDAFGGHGGLPTEAGALAGSLRAVEVHAGAFEATRAAVVDLLESRGVAPLVARELAASWLVHDDFLLTRIDGKFDFVVGNPPYVRQERIPEALLGEYRRRYLTIYDRADLYVPFFERGFDLLAVGGRLAFICANRWLKNKYGGPLRALASSSFNLSYFIDLEGSPAFHAEVIAYPAITVFERGGTGTTRIARRPEVSATSLGRLAAAMLGAGSAADARVEDVERAVSGADPWLLDAPDRLRLLRRLEDRFPDLEGAGCKVGIGVATGLDKVFIGKLDALPVEPARKLPLVMAGDLEGTELCWRGFGVVNPFNDDGSLADLDAFPLFGAYMRENEARLAARHCAQRAESGWYRTIDRITPSLATRPKLLVPDIKGEPTVVLDSGQFYPHHNLYFLVSDDWELPALATLLRSSVSVLFVASYCVRMSGGFLRFQAQYLRRIRVPCWSRLPEAARQGLRDASATLDLDVVDAAAAEAYGLTAREARLAREVGDQNRVRSTKNARPTAAA